MIKWKPTKAECYKMLAYRLAVVVTPESERVLIGTLGDIVVALSGRETTELIYDQTHPFGHYLLNQEYDLDWGTMVFWLSEAQGILNASLPERYWHWDESNVDRERIVEEFLREKCMNRQNPFTLYVAIRIWYRYWLIRGLKNKDKSQEFINFAQNLVRPFITENNTCIQKVIITPDNPIFSSCRESAFEDCVSVMYTPIRKPMSGSFSDPPIRCLLLENSLLPLNAYYKTQIQLHPRYLIQCRICKTLFIREDLRSDLCSEACRAKAAEENNARRLKDPVTAEIEHALNNVRGHWTRRLQSIKKSPDWPEQKVKEYTQAFGEFKKDAIEMRQKHKNGEITLKEYKDWLFDQQERANDVMQELIKAEYTIEVR